MTDIDRINKLFALVLVAFVWVFKIGIFLDYKCPINITLERGVNVSLCHT